MTLRFFGERWDAPILGGAEQGSTPIGEVCFVCGRSIEDGDQGLFRSALMLDEIGPDRFVVVHRGCEMADMIGHHFGVCKCAGWADVYEAGQELVRRIDAGESFPRGVID